MTPPKPLKNLEITLGISFKSEDLLKEALTHRSYLNENPRWPIEHNERLEYLGDAVAELIVSDFLFRKFSDWPEGQLTVIRASLVNYQTMAKMAEDINLDAYLYLSRGERRDTGKAREVIWANAAEALLGAVYLDQGIGACRKILEKFLFPRLPEILKTKSYKDAKSELQELIQEKLRITPVYKLIEETGPAHDRIFKMGVYFGDKFIADGSGSSKQEAELDAAKNALEEKTYNL